MTKMKKVALIFPLILIFSVIISPLSASAYETNGFEVKSKTALLYSIDTDSVIYSKKADEKMYPASLTKLMTAVIAVEKCPDLDKKVTVKGETVDKLLGSGSTVANLKDGEKISMRDLLHALLISSAADAAEVIADEIAGGSDAFVKLMNERAKQLGMNSTNFMNTHGLHDDKHYTTANDLLRLSKHILEMPIITDICSKSSYTIAKTNKSDERWLTTTNMLQNASTAYYYKYAKGLKTGFTTPAGRCLISTASYKGYNYLCIILGGDDSTRTEYTDTANLYRWAFTNFEYRKIADTTDQIAEIEVDLSMDTDHVQLFPQKQVSAIIPENIDNSSIIYDVVLSADKTDAPVQKGQVLGYARVMCANQEIAKVNLVAGDNVERSTLLLIKHILGEIITSTLFKILLAALVVLIILAIIVNIIRNKQKRSRYKKVTRIRKY